jgi:glycerophosphoryl diester phosphodiesterase
MSALFNPHSDLVMLSAHRGIHALAGLNQASGVPENPLESIGLVAQAGWEMIELDVKLTSDGVPMLSHDRRSFARASSLATSNIRDTTTCAFERADVSE